MEKIHSRLKNHVKSSERIIILGRGPSSRFYTKTKGDFVISFHHNSFRDTDYIFTNEVQTNLRRELEKNDNFSSLEAGSVELGWHLLLYYLDSIIDYRTLVCLFGFDFHSYTQDDDILKQTDRINLQRTVDVNSQLEFYRRLKGTYKNINLKRFAFDVYSDFDPRGFSPTKMGYPDVEIVAEITTNHFGDTERLEKLMCGAFEAGADSVKLQMRDVNSFYTSQDLNRHYRSPFGNTLGDYRRQLELSDEQINIAHEIAGSYNKQVFFSVLDMPSLKRIKKWNPFRIKLPSTISRKTHYLSEVCNHFNGEIVISLGMTNDEYLDFVQNTFKKISKLYILHCISSYPTFWRDLNLGLIKSYDDLSQRNSSVIPGFSSHDIGSIASVMAIANGARMIEKHIKTGNTDWAHFDDTALDVTEAFPLFVEDIRKAQLMQGDGLKRVLNSEHHKY